MPVSIDLEQMARRLARLGSSSATGFFEELTTRWGYSDYTHIEFEGDEVGTTFLVEGVEGRVELIQHERGGWRGSVGGQYLFRDFAAVGAEAFVPPNTTEQRRAVHAAGSRVRPVRDRGRRPLRAHRASAPRRSASSAAFDTFSGALGLPTARRRACGSGSTARAPRARPRPRSCSPTGRTSPPSSSRSAIPALRQETALGARRLCPRATSAGRDFGRRRSTAPGSTTSSISRRPAPRRTACRSTSQLQQGADYFGVEAEASFPLFRAAGFRVIGDVQGDYVRATLADGTPVPRIPPLSLLGALELQSDALDLRGEVQWFDAQDRIAPFETPTDELRPRQPVGWRGSRCAATRT